MKEETAVVPAVTIRGGWQEAVAQLLQGSKLNYASLAPAPGHAAKLMVGPRPEGGGELLSTSADREDRARLALKAKFGGVELTPEQASILERVRRLGKHEATEASDNRAAADSPRESGTQSGSPSAYEDAGSLDYQPPVMGGPPMPPPPAGPRVMPFPDEHGNPIPASPLRPIGGPFIDENGNPLPVRPVPSGQQVWPFPPDTPASSGPKTP